MIKIILLSAWVFAAPTKNSDSQKILKLGSKWSFERFGEDFKTMSSARLAPKGVFILENREASSYHIFFSQLDRKAGDQRTAAQYCEDFKSEQEKIGLRGKINTSILKISNQSVCSVEKTDTRGKKSKEIFLLSPKQVAQMSVQFGNASHSDEYFKKTALSHLRYHAQ